MRQYDLPLMRLSQIPTINHWVKLRRLASVESPLTVASAKTAHSLSNSVWVENMIVRSDTNNAICGIQKTNNPIKTRSGFMSTLMSEDMATQINTAPNITANVIFVFRRVRFSKIANVNR